MKTTVVLPLLIIMLLMLGIQNNLSAQPFEEGRKTVLSSLPAMKGYAIAKDSFRIVQDSISGGNKQIKNIIVFKIKEDSSLYFKSPFTATVKFYLDTRTTIASSPVTSSLYTLTVNYDTTLGSKYNVRAYMVLDQSYEEVKIRVDELTITGNTAWDPQPVLELDNQMQVLRYFELSTNAVTQTAGFGTPIFLNDALKVNWFWPDPSLHNNMVQLEWAWLEDEMQALYIVNGVLNTDLLFKNNSTRIDLDEKQNNYKIPLLYDGEGKLYYRVRPMLRKNNGTNITGKWTLGNAFAFNGHEPDLNWQSSTSFAEGGKLKTVIQYFDGSLRNRQTVTKDNETGNTIVGETLYDLQGRPNVQILPTPTIDNTIKFFDDFNRFVGQTSKADDPARFFDLTPAAIKYQSAPILDTAYGNGRYYSGNNDWLTSETKTKFIPNAHGYAYTETRFMDDATQRVSSQSGVGANHIIGSGKETKYYYGKPTQKELDALFGTEVGDASHYSKNMVKDANGQLSISYVDMHGRTIATALAGDSTGNLAAIANSLYYPAVSGTLEAELLTPATNLIKGNSIESVTTLLVEQDSTNYTFKYELNPAILALLDCNNQQICFDCKYDLEISIRQEEANDAAPIVKRYHNLQIVPANQAATTSMGFVGEGITNPTNTISFSKKLSVGSWVIRKTLIVNDSLFQIRKDSALKAFLCRTQDSIFQAVKMKLIQSAGCSEAANSTSACDSCYASLGNYAQYKAKYLASIGQASFDEATLRNQYLADSTTCANACSMSSNLSTLNTIRTQMLADMIPFTGQYAIDAIKDINTGVVTPIPTGSKQALYNIFMGVASGSTVPYYQRPVTEAGEVLPLYQTEELKPDIILLDASGASLLPTLNKFEFTNLFQRSWAANLIYYHPEFSKLKFAETQLAAAYAWLDSVNATETYSAALSKGYLNPLTSDPYFTNNYVASDYSLMQGYLNGTASLSFWKLANSTVICATEADVVLSACLSNCNSTGLDNNILSVADKNKVWETFKSLYLSYRNQMVLNYINSQPGVLSTSLANDLQLENKQLRFASAQDLANQNGIGTIWSAAASGDTSVAASAAASYTSAQGLSQDKCEAQRPYWKAKLLQCDQLLNKLTSNNPAEVDTANAIINTILDSMVMVCQNAKTGWQPYGASTVAPNFIGNPKTFESIIRNVFAQNNIADTLGTSGYYCNPFTIDAPGPYGTNLPVANNIANSIDSCGCARFAALKIEADALNYYSNSYSSMNDFLKIHYNDTLTETVWNALQWCGYNTPVYVKGQWVIFTTKLKNPEVIPTFLNCGYQKPCLTCSTLTNLTNEFKQLYPGWDSIPYSTVNNNDTLLQRNELWTRFINYRTGLQLNTANYAAAYNQCANSGVTYIIGNGNDCGNLTAVDTLLINERLAPYTHTYVAKKAVIVQDGFISNDGDEFIVSVDSSLASCSMVTGIAGSSYTIGGSNSTAIALCGSNKPLNDIGNYFVKDSLPCKNVETQAQFIAQLLYVKMQDSLIANFDSLYMAKCLSAQSVEIFTATYTPKEYHYTLYYYDQAGNLVKTLPPAAVQPNFNSTYLNNVAISRNMGIAYPNPNNNELMATNYRYNSLNQVVAQQTPDAGISRFWYDRLGRLALSQNAKQISNNQYSYTLYDLLGRITEVGQLSSNTAITDSISKQETSLATWLNNANSTKEQITQTVYDIAYTPLMQPTAGSFYQQNLRNRVSYSQLWNYATDTYAVSATYYSYDIHGNVDTLLQDYGNSSGTANAMNTTGNRFKKIVYDYDLISGKVNLVAYQPNQADAFYHSYSYDAENKLTKVQTSKDQIYWETDATYEYYRHGPLYSITLGELQVQNTRHAYTIQGWLKSINPIDNSSSNNYLIGKNAYNLVLNYNNADYTGVGIASPSANIPSQLGSDNNQLYNGNISSMGINIPQLGNAILYNYKYDQLNRIVAMDAWNSSNAIWGGLAKTGDYKERFTFNPDGGITSLLRHGAGRTIDSAAWNYNTNKHQLNNINDPAGRFGFDAGLQSANNYTYSAIGEMTSDTERGMTNIDWTVYGKVKSQTINGTVINYTYDASGNRISKTVSGSGGYTESYVRDASGNVMSIYRKEGNNPLQQTELSIYGSSRLGTVKALTVAVVIDANGNKITTFTRGEKNYDLNDHRGNVLVTITDKNIPHNNGSDGIDYYNADVVTAQDYSSFGSLLEGRQYGTTPRRTYNGKELDKETGWQDYGMRPYLVDVPIFSKTDPLTGKFPELTPYQFASNTPLMAIDLDGLEKYVVTITAYKSHVTGKIEILNYRKVEVNNPHNLGTGTLIQTFTWQGSKTGVSGGTPTSAYIPEKKSLLQKASDFLNSIFTHGDESNKERPGFIIFGEAKYSDWSNGLPKAAPGSETIDLDKFLALAGGMREGLGPANLAEDFGNSAKLAHLLEKVDKIKEAIEKTQEAFEKVKEEKKEDEEPQDSCTFCHEIGKKLDPKAHSGKIVKTQGKKKKDE